MRKRKGLSHVPSLRTAIAIPRFLTARVFRKGALIPQDYLDAAVLNTPYEDQPAARGDQARPGTGIPHTPVHAPVTHADATHAVLLPQVPFAEQVSTLFPLQ